MIRLLLLAVILALAACSDVKTTAPAPVAAVPARLVGVWSGTWTTAAGDSAGDLTLRVQEFDDQPVVQIETDLPCISGTTFVLRFQATSFTATIGAQQVLRGELGAADTLSGTFACDAGVGTWQTTRIRSLPEVVDLSGVWTGALYREGAPPQPFTLRLVMALESGILRLGGDLTVEGSPTSPIAGLASDFESSGYQLFFESADGSYFLRAQCSGLYAPLRVETGQWGIFDGGTAIVSGVFAMDRQAP